jgi:hypothetical protein
LSSLRKPRHLSAPIIDYHRPVENSVRGVLARSSSLEWNIAASQPRTVGDLLSAAETIAKERARKLAAERAIDLARREAEEEAKRARYLDQLAKREQITWDQVTELIQKKQPKAYDQAIKLLVDLHDLAIRQGAEAVFRARIQSLREKHFAKTGFLRRLESADL